MAEGPQRDPTGQGRPVPVRGDGRGPNAPTEKADVAGSVGDVARAILERLRRKLGTDANPRGRGFGSGLFEAGDDASPVRTDGSGNVLCFPESGSGVQVKFLGRSRNNVVWVDPEARASLLVTVFGNGNHVCVSRTAKWNGRMTVSGRNNLVFVAERATSNRSLCLVNGDGQSVLFGEDCMLSMAISIRASDSHAIFDCSTREVINASGDVVLEPHVWVGEDVSILKDVTVGAGAVIGSGSVVTRSVPAKSLVVGAPARVVRENVTWSRQESPSPEDIQRAIAFVDRFLRPADGGSAAR